jgi:hypothetical protein
MKLRDYYPYFEDFHEDIKSLAKKRIAGTGEEDARS